MLIIPPGFTPGQALTARREGGLAVSIFCDEIGGGVWTGPFGITGKLLTVPGQVEPGLVLTSAQWIMEFLRRYSDAAAQAQLDLGVQYWAGLDEVRRAVLADIAYQDGGGNPATGQGGLAGFHRMLGAVRVHDWITARLECLDSDNFRKTRSRCEENGDMLLTGIMPALAA